MLALGMSGLGGRSGVFDLADRRGLRRRVAGGGLLGGVLRCNGFAGLGLVVVGVLVVVIVVLVLARCVLVGAVLVGMAFGGRRVRRGERIALHGFVAAPVGALAGAVAAAAAAATAAAGTLLGFLVVARGACVGVDQRLPVGDRDLVVVGMDFRERQEAVAVAAILDERRLQRRLDAGDLG